MTIDAALTGALAGAFTRPVPKSAGAQVRYLVKQHKGSTKAVATLLGISQRTVERYVKDQIKRPRRDLAERMAAEVRRRWQPQIRAKARKTAATAGLMVDVRARFGFTAAPGTTDDARMRHLTLALPPHHAARLLDAQAAGATDRELQQATADALGEVYFRDGGHRAHDLLVELTDIEQIAFEL
ncbi:telomere-protecting terminal protein Tpg [Streptomyces sp. NPDC056632]|uniref:telomere-protecting terminal protein Tpg n=1 Tax=Streptomyces sp. NPDC056632 TaxID=3345884 RepID=UPI00367AA348